MRLKTALFLTALFALLKGDNNEYRILDSTAIPKHIPIPRPSFPHNWVEYEYTSAEQTIERAKDADIIITSKVILSREVLQQLPKIKIDCYHCNGHQ